MAQVDREKDRNESLAEIVRQFKIHNRLCGLALFHQLQFPQHQEEVKQIIEEIDA